MRACIVTLHVYYTPKLVNKLPEESNCGNRITNAVEIEKEFVVDSLPVGVDWHELWTHV